MAMKQPLPDSCIRGPELHDPQAIQQQIAQQDEAALECYCTGIELVQHVWRLLKMQQRLHERRAARTFLLHQLRVMEQQHPQGVSAALALFDQQRRSDRMVLTAPESAMAEDNAEQA